MTQALPDHDIETVAFVSLGCPKNLVDSEKMLGLLAESGLTPVPAELMEEGGADAVVVNTCGFLEASKDESMGEIARAAELKQQGLVKRLVVAGCLVQRHRAKMLDWCPDIDALIGIYDRDRVEQAVRPSAPDREALRAGDEPSLSLPVFSSIARTAAEAAQARGVLAPDQSKEATRRIGYFEDDAARLRLTPRHYAYLRISEGCNQQCAFCTIPSIRGKMRSKPVDKILNEARELLADGAVELMLIGQDTTSYGDDIGYEPGLPGLLRELDEVAADYGGAWLRLMYAYPSKFDDASIDALAACQNILPYIDMPLQHINDRVLDRMRRHTSRELIETLLGKLRDRLPGMALRTTFISGFPGETDAEHRELVDFVGRFRFENLGVFAYSPEPGTWAGKQHEREAIPEEVIQERIDEIMSAQQAVVFDRNDERANSGEELEVLIDGVLGDAATVFEAGVDDDEVEAMPPIPEGLTRYVGRSYRQSPDIDTLTYVDSREPLSPGERLPCKAVASLGYDLLARPTSEADPGRLPLPVVG